MSCCWPRVGTSMPARRSTLMSRTDDGAQAAVEQAEAEVFVREEAALLARLGSQPQQPRAAESDDAAVDADLEVVLAGIEGQTHGDLLAVVKRLAGRFVGGND